MTIEIELNHKKGKSSRLKSGKSKSDGLIIRMPTSHADSYADF